MQNRYSSKIFPLDCGRFLAYNLRGDKQPFNTRGAANIYSRTGGPLTPYKGFQIAPNKRIFKNGVQVFDAHWQLCETIDECKALIDQSEAERTKPKLILKQVTEPTNYEQFQIEHYGNVLGNAYVEPSGHSHNTPEELERLNHFKNMQQ